MYCHKPFGEIHWHDHPPALLDSERKTVEWNEIPAEKLQEVLGTHWPVCSNCHVAETFRREHPELVVDRPETPLRMSILKYVKQSLRVMKVSPEGKGDHMQGDNRDALEILKSELRFLENGGYRESPRTTWRPQLFFEDSLTCLNYGSRQRLPCSECVLMAFVPQDCRGERIPCRHIFLDVEGYTIDTYYRLEHRKNWKSA